MGVTPLESSVPVATAQTALHRVDPPAPAIATRRIVMQTGCSEFAYAASFASDTNRHRFFTPYLTAAQLIAASPKRKQGFELATFTKNGTAARAMNASRPFGATRLKFNAPAKVGPRELIKAVQCMDMSPLKQAGIKATACFDFDKTLAAGDIFYDFCEVLQARMGFPQHNAKRVREALVLASNGAVRKGDLVGASTDAVMKRAIGMAREGRLDGAAVFFMLIAAIRGLHEHEVNAIAEELFEKGAPGKAPYKNNFFTSDGVGSIDLCKALKAKGIEPHIITLGIPIVARVGARYLGIDAKNVHGSELEVQNGKFTGRALDAAVLGKHQMADHYVSSTPLFCFGDTLGSDCTMLSRATVGAFVVDPNIDFHVHMSNNRSDIRWLTYKNQAS